jgi:cytochrome P450
MSYSPFFGGKRVCLGRTFSETSAKITIPIILSLFDFKFVDPIDEKRKLDNNFAILEKPKVFVKVIKRDKY